MNDSVFRVSRNRAIAGLTLAICFTLMQATSQTAIRVEFDKGELRKVEPRAATLFMGGG